MATCTQSLFANIAHMGHRPILMPFMHALIDAEKIEERRFVIKITCKGGGGIGGEVLRVIESLGLEITYVALEQIKPLHVLTTVFVRVIKLDR
ncbi:hypothetical protein ACLOJK_021174 [Asimina triloba]